MKLGLVGILIFLILLAICPDSLFDPPYWDTIHGIFRQGIWLSEHNFNYYQLLFNEKGYSAGGPRVYILSIVPAFIGLLFHIFGTDATILVTHLLTLIFASIGIVFYYLIAKEFLTKYQSACLALLLVSCPLLLAQIYSISLEIWVTSLSLVAVYCFFKNKFFTSAIILVLAFLIKQTIFPICLATFLTYFLFYRHTCSKSCLVLFLMPILIFIFNSYLDSIAYLSGGDTIISPKALFDLGILVERIQILAVLNYDLALIILLVLGLAGLNYYLVKANPQIFLLLILIVIYLLSFLSSSVLLSRYLVPLLPYLLLLLFVFLQERERPLFSAATYLLILAFFIFNLNGNIYNMIYKDKTYFLNQGFLLERTLAFRKDLKIQQKIVQEVADKYQDYLIYTAWPAVHILSNPKYGYVDKKLNAVSAFRPYEDSAPVNDSKQKILLYRYDNIKPSAELCQQFSDKKGMLFASFYTPNQVYLDCMEFVSNINTLSSN